MEEKEAITTLANRLENIKEQIKNLTAEQEALEALYVLFRQSLQRKYETLSNPSQLLQDYQDPSKREGAIAYLKQYMKVFFPQSTSIEIAAFCGPGEIWYHIWAIIDNEDVRLDVPTYKKNVLPLDATDYCYKLSTDLSFQSAFDPTELIQYKENE